MLLLLAAISNAQPFGADISDTNNSRAPADAPETHEAQAGNVTQLEITGFSVTQAWQGYYGNVSGSIILADSSDNQLYNWSLANPEGEVYAANQTVTWTDIQCFNFTGTGSYDNSTDIPGATSHNGTNLTQLESYYGIASDDVDGVDETFAGTTHDAFYVSSQLFSADECRATTLFSNSGAPITGQFEEALLYDPLGRMPVYAAIIEEAAVLGFNGEDNDFEMIVLDNGHNGNVDTTTYYFYLEIE